MLILHSSSLGKYGLNRIFEFVKESGYDGIEIGVDKNNFDTQNAEYLKKLSEAYQVPIIALETPANGSSKIVEHVISMAAYLKCSMVVVNPPKLLDFQFAGWLKKSVPFLRKQKKIDIALVNAPSKNWLGILPANAMNNLSDLKEFKMVALDTSSTVSKKIELIRMYEHLKKYIVHVHLSNVRRNREYAMPNEGILPLESLLRKLKENNYEGAISLLVKPTELGAGDDEKVIKMLKKAKDFYEEFYGN